MQGEAQANAVPLAAFLVQQMLREWMPGQPSPVDRELDRISRAAQLESWQLDVAPRVTQNYSKTQRQNLRGTHGIGKCSADLLEIAALTEHELGQLLLVVGQKTGETKVGDEIRTVLVIVIVRDGETHLVQCARPRQVLSVA